MAEISQEQIDELKTRRKWLSALKIADKSEKDWRDQSAKIFERYRGTKAKKNSFNILYSNTDTLAPSVLNSQPKPDVRRRWNDADPLGKAVSEVMNRGLTFSIDDAGFMEALELNLYDYLLSGRAISRVRYVPQFQEMAGIEESPEYEQQESENYEELAWEQVVLEHVQYDDFRRGPGRSWCEVCWIAFKHRLDKEEIAERFGQEKADAMSFDDVEEDEKSTKRKDDDKLKSGTAEVWEIWDKDKKQVMFLSQHYAEGLLNVLEDPLKLQGFYPIPKPLYAFKDSTSLIPVPLFEPYRQQAEELDKISNRIVKLEGALKANGIYDATISELGNLMQADDNALIPAQNISMIIDRGGLDKAIWM